MDTTRLQDKIVLVTGAAQGMGAAVAEHYAAQGAKVCVGDVNVDGVNEVAQRINDAGGTAIAVNLDVTKRVDIIAAVAATVEAFGSINVVLNNAGINKPLMFLDITEDKDLVAIGKFEKEGESMDQLAEGILLKRYSQPEDILGTASFLASSESDYMTGQLLMIDGGMVVQ